MTCSWTSLSPLFVAASVSFSYRPNECRNRPQVPIRIIGVAQPSPEEHETPIDPVTRHRRPPARSLANLRLRFRRQHLVSIEDENPFIPKGQMLERPVLFLRPGAIEIELHHRALPSAPRFRSTRPCFANLRRRSSSAHGYRREAPRQVVRFVLDRHDQGNGHARAHLGRSTLQGFPAAKTSAGTSLVTTEQAPTDAACTNRNSRHDKGARTDKCLLAHDDLADDEWHARAQEVVAPGAQINLLRNCGPRTDFDLA